MKNNVKTRFKKNKKTIKTIFCRVNITLQITYCIPFFSYFLLIIGVRHLRKTIFRYLNNNYDCHRSRYILRDVGHLGKWRLKQPFQNITDFPLYTYNRFCWLDKLVLKCLRDSTTKKYTHINPQNFFLYLSL